METWYPTELSHPRTRGGPRELILVCDARVCQVLQPVSSLRNSAESLLCYGSQPLPLRTGVLRRLLLPVPLCPYRHRGLRLARLLFLRTKEHSSLNVIWLPVAGRGPVSVPFYHVPDLYCALQLPERATCIHKYISRGRDLKELVS
jgi:hypothetical protein